MQKTIGLALLASVWIAITGPVAQSQTVPQWQTAAGGKMAFDVASVRPSKGTFRPPDFPLDAGDAFASRQTNLGPGGTFSADFPLAVYIEFAYKIWPTPELSRQMLAPLPKWVSTDRFDIQARAEGNPTKDQMRLMMQSLLADRFRLKVHFETPVVPALALMVVNPGKTGPKLRPHAEGLPCDSAAGAEVFPPLCDVVMVINTPERMIRGGSRNSAMDLLAFFLASAGRLGRPVVNQTGLSGKFDFQLEWAPDPTSPVATGAAAQPDTPGPTFLDALREQLGLKLESTKAPIGTLVIDHVELPSDN